MTDLIFLGSKITADGDCSHEINMLAPWKKIYDQPRQHIKKQRHYFANKGPPSQSLGFSSSNVWMRSEERRVGKEWKQCQTLFWGAPKSLQMVTAAMKLKDAYSLKGVR